MTESRNGRPAICLNMIVRNEAHIVHEVLDAVAPYIASWVIVDTGSVDGTQDVIRKHMAALGIPGEIHERPWRNFGENRSEAIDLAKGHGDYIWVIDADDMVTGTPDFSSLDADVYEMRYLDAGTMTYWRKQVFRDGLRWRYTGVVHEFPECLDPTHGRRLEGDYHIESRRLGARSQDPEKYARDRDLLLAEVARNPDDARSVFYLAQSYFDLGDFANARTWYDRRAAMGGWEEEVFRSMFRVAESMSNLGDAWPEVQDAFLRAWEYRPVRAEPLHAIACRYRLDERYQLGYLFAKKAVEIPFPEGDVLFIGADVYAWRAKDELAVCASRLQLHPEAFDLSRQLVAGTEISDDDRKRIAANRDWSVPTMLEEALTYPAAVVQTLTSSPRSGRDSEVTVSLVAGPDRGAAEVSLNSFLNCCLDVSRVGRVLVVDTGLSAQDRAILLERYPFLEFSQSKLVDQPGALLTLRDEIGGRFWLHLGRGWQFFAPERLINRLISVLAAEPDVVQVAINYGDAATLTGACTPEDAVRRAPGAGRYTLTDDVAQGPAMFDTARLDRATAASRSACLDEVLCIAGV
jgi:glycosyltransferase involved in cell wall biosynthesis